MALRTVTPGEAICGTDQLRDGQSVKFRVLRGTERFEAFLVRHEGRFHAWKNECAHLPLPLDLDDNDFFTIDQRHLICKTHAATFEPATGEGISGPGLGRSLTSVEIEIRGGEVVLKA